MVDMTKCSGDGCEKKNQCYRHMAHESALQLYFIEPPVRNGECEYFCCYNAPKETSNGVNNAR